MVMLWLRNWRRGGKLPIDMAIRYRALSRAVGNRLEASLGNKWWEVASPKEMAVGRAAPAIDKAARRRRERQKAEGFHFFGLHFGGSSAPKKEEEEEPRHGGGGGGGDAAAADDNDDDSEDDSSLSRRVRARWSIAGIMSEWQLQRLQEDLANGDEVLPSSSSSDTTLTSSSSSRLPADYIKANIEVILSGLNLTLYLEGHEKLHSLSIQRIRVQVKQRAHLNGLGLQAHVGTLTYTDLSTPYPELQRVIRRASPTGGQLLSLALETEPLHSNAAIHADARLEHIEVRFHPRVAASILAYFMPPADQWAAVVEVSQVLWGFFASIGGLIWNAVLSVCVHGASIRPVLIALSVAPPTLLWIEPPKQQQAITTPSTTTTNASKSSMRRGSFAEALAMTFTDASFVDFLTRSLAWDPTERLTVENAAGHDWITKINLHQHHKPGLAARRSPDTAATQRPPSI